MQSGSDGRFSPLFEWLDHGHAVPDRAEFGLYVALKLHVYRRHSRTNNGPANAQHGLTVRKVCRLVESRRGNVEQMHDQYTELFDVSAHFIRERLKRLNHGTVLTADGRGLRHASLYQWSEPISSGCQTSFDRLNKTLGPHLNFALDVYRLAEGFGTQPFTVDAFLDLFRTMRQSLLGRRWYEIHTHTPPASIHFTKFLLGRLRALVSAGLVVNHGAPKGLIVTPRGAEAAHWFELFVYAVDYQAQHERAVR